MRAVVEDLSDCRGEQATSLRPKVQELFGRVTSRTTTDGRIWKSYAKLYGDGHSQNPEDNEKVCLSHPVCGGMLNGSSVNECFVGSLIIDIWL